MAIVEVVKYNGGPDVFAWKYPSEELGTWTQLIVNESQEAVLFKGGQALDVFQSGRHTLDTANIPILNKIINIPFGGKSPFKAEIWYINKVHSLDIKWGTPTPIQLQDPKYGVFVPVRSFGQFGIQIEESKKFLVKLVGTLPLFNKDNLVKYFRGLYITKVKDAISTYLIEKKISILEINMYLDELSEFMKERLQPTMDEYGIRLVNFYVNDINVPEDDPAVKKLKDALAKRAEMNIIGYNYQQERSFNTLEGAAKNPGSASANIMGAGLGLGMGVGMGGAVGGSFSKMAGQVDINSKDTKECPVCHMAVDKEAVFCSGCGYDFRGNKDKKSQATTNEIKCSNCGERLSEKAKFCPGCGKKYNPCPNCGMDMPEGIVECSNCGYKPPKPCPKCGAPVSENAKFCSECGEPLVRRCPGCNSVIEGKPKFCPECGAKL